MVVIETDRLLLRHLAWDDLDALAAVMGDAEVMRHVGTGKPKTREQTRRLMEHWIADARRDWDALTLERLPQLRRAAERGADFGLWATVHKPDRRLIGRCGLLAWDLDGRPEVEVGYLLARRYWGRGLATEAARAIRDHAFDRLGFDRVISLIHPANVASQRVAEKSGMRHERDAVVHGTTARVYAIERADPAPAGATGWA
jgi:ribosomal-protein-alanine N-acetyltransferase